VLAGPGIEDQFLSRIHVRAIVGALGGQLDAGYIERTLMVLEEALSPSDLLPAWRAAIDRS
jgi:hypothetical protein